MVECPKCRSDQLTVLEAAYPESFECNNCKFIFIKIPNSLRDEELD
ncbi:MAG TPA: hypothetical protein VJH34_03340 [archaeon]|nr:hypothetical protein [archaeon]